MTDQELLATTVVPIVTSPWAFIRFWPFLIATAFITSIIVGAEMRESEDTAWISYLSLVVSMLVSAVKKLSQRQYAMLSSPLAKRRGA